MTLKNIFYYIIPINLIFDIFLFFFEKGGLFSSIKAVVLFFLLLMVLKKKINKTSYFSATFLFIIYVLINVIFSTNVLISLTISLRILLSLAFVFVGFCVFNTPSAIKKLNHSVIISLIILTINYIVSNTLKIGTDAYTDSDDFLVGNLSTAWNVYTYLLIPIPFILLTIQKNLFTKICAFALVIFNVIVLILSIKRIAISVFFIGIFLFYLLAGKIGKTLKTILIIACLLLATLPLYEDLLLNRINARANRFEEGALEREGRYLETPYIWNEVLSFENPIKSIFGLEGFNSVGNYAKGKFGDRNAHIDYNLIVNTLGIFGLGLYFYIFADMILLFFKLQKNMQLPYSIFTYLRSLFFTLIICQFITSFSGQMYLITPRMIIFLYLGAILGLMHNYKRVS